jgi:hypothetical protein
MIDVNISRALAYIHSKGSERAEVQARSLLPHFYESVRFNFAYKVIPAAAVNGGNDLDRCICGCGRVVVSAGTLGAAFDRESAAVALSNVSDGLVFDALGSAYIEQLCDSEMEGIADKYGFTFTRHYSPGYGDCPLEYSKFVLGQLRSIGVYQTAGGMLSPMKSITRITGIKELCGEKV